MTRDARKIRDVGLSEKELQALVVEAARRMGWLSYHTAHSIHSAAGFPDLVLVHTRSGRLIFVELKTRTGAVSPAQAAWLDALGRLHYAVVWRPEDWHSGHVVEVLLEHGNRATPPGKRRTP